MTTPDPLARPLHQPHLFARDLKMFEFPEEGMPPRAAYELLHTALMLDGRETLNLASFVTTWMDPEVDQLIRETLPKNHIDHEEYPAAQLVEEMCVRALGHLFNAPVPDDVTGVGTIGSSEAIMLGLLAHKFAWRKRREADGKPADKPNVVFGAETHIVWDKFARYFDVEMRKVPMRPDRYVVASEDIEPLIDENTIAVGAVLGTTFTGQSDPIEEINALMLRVKEERGWDIPIHVDAASGGFVTPFAHPDRQWDFRLEQVASINASGHKYGLVYPGVGWLVFRDRSKLPEELVFSVNYLGGAQPTYTFNFSRGSAMIQAQAFQILRLGRKGYTEVVQTMRNNAQYLSDELVKSGRFELLNPELVEPVVAAKLKGDPGYDVYQVSAALREKGWIVPAYSLPPNAEHVDVLRVVVRVDMSRPLLEVLVLDIDTACQELQKRQPGGSERVQHDLWTKPEHAAGRAAKRFTGLK